MFSRRRRPFAIFLISSVIVALVSCFEDISEQIAAQSRFARPGMIVAGLGHIRCGEQTLFTARTASGKAPAVRWSVNGLDGGSNELGRISAAGVYTAPDVVPPAARVTIAALSAETPHISGNLEESILNPVPTVTAALASRIVPEPDYVLDVQGEHFVPGSKLQIAGVAVPTTFISSKDVQTILTVAPGTVSLAVTVLNPEPGGASSGVVAAQIRSPGRRSQLWEPMRVEAAPHLWELAQRE